MGMVRCRCGWEGAVDDALAGQTIRCLACGSPVVVPEVAAGVSPAAAPAESAAGSASAPSSESVPPSSATDPPSSVPPSAGQSVWAPAAKFDVRSLLQRLRRVVQPAWEYVRAAVRFYRAHRPQLRAGARLWITDYLPALDEPEDIRREIRTPLVEEGRVREEAGVWCIDLPARCVVCGAEPKGESIEETRSVLDPFALIATPLAALALGLILGGWYRSLLWPVLVPFAGVLIGYALRRTEEFRLRFSRCARHAEDRLNPELAVFHRRLVLRFGSREAKLAYLRAGDEAPEPGNLVPSLDPRANEPPETIALAESVEPDAAIIPEDIGDRLPGAEGYDLAKPSDASDRSQSPNKEVL